MGLRFLSTQYGPRNAAAEDVFEEWVTTHVTSPESTPGWNLYHRLGGEVHCGVAAVREIFDFKWWEELE